MAVFVELFLKREALKRQAQALLRAQEELEERVRCADAELATANESLRAEVEERKRIEAERLMLLESERHARAQAEAVNRLKDEFLATLSHELRTPLNAILGWSHLLASGQTDPAMVERAIGIIRNNATAQSQLIEDILDVSRIIGGKLRLKIAPVALTNIIDAALDSVTPAAEAKAITIEREIDDIDPISGDPDRLQQVIWNLLSNAVKFTPREGRRGGAAGAAGRRGRALGPGHRHRHLAGLPALRLRPLQPGGRNGHAASRRPRARHGDRAAPRGAARRHRARRQRWREPGRDVHPDAADARR